MSRRNEYFDQGFSDESEKETDYDSEDAEINKTERRGTKRKKLSYSPAGSDEGDVGLTRSLSKTGEDLESTRLTLAELKDDAGVGHSDVQGQEIDYQIKSAAVTVSKPSNKPKKEKKPGVVYLSSLPPYLKPSALRNLLSQRGFEPITRLFLTPSSKHKHDSKKNSRQLYSEGWIEFASKKTAKQCAEALNAQLVGGRKGGFYHDDLWNLKYLRGMAWDELMAGIREERREEEGRRDEERRKIAVETKAYIEGVERGKRLEGMRRKRKAKGAEVDKTDVIQRTWRQHEVATDRDEKSNSAHSLNPEVRQVLSKII